MDATICSYLSFIVPKPTLIVVITINIAVQTDAHIVGMRYVLDDGASFAERMRDIIC